MVNGSARIVERYGDGPLSVGEWWVPAGPAGELADGATEQPVEPSAISPAGGATEESTEASSDGRLPTVVLIHGGYWRQQYDRSLEDAVAEDLAARGYLVWVPDYRSSAVQWPATLTDMAAAYEHLVAGSQAHLVDPARVATVGHSAGGHLAFWLAGRDAIPADGVGAVPAAGAAPRPVLAVGQAPVADLALAYTQGLGGGAVLALIGGSPDEFPERYAVADPVALLPTGVRTVCIHGSADDTVPLSQPQTWVRKATDAGDDATLVEVPGDHFIHLDPSTEAVARLRDALAAL